MKPIFKSFVREHDMKTKGIVFDFGGVMTPMLMPEMVRRLVDNLGVDWDAVVAGYGKYRRQMDGDLISMEEMYRRIWADMKLSLAPAVCRELVDADLCSYFGRDLATLELMKSLKARGFKIGILTNMHTRFATHFRVIFADYIALADAMVISGEEHLYKPQPEIYELMRARMNLPADALVFIDDAPENCDGARAAGWRAIRFTSAAQASAELDRLLVEEES